MWRETIARARTCYGTGAQDGCAWRQLEEQLRMCLVADGRLWENAGKVQQTAIVALVYFDVKARLEESLEQMKVHIPRWQWMAGRTGSRRENTQRNGRQVQLLYST